MENSSWRASFYLHIIRSALLLLIYDETSDQRTQWNVCQLMHTCDVFVSNLTNNDRQTVYASRRMDHGLRLAFNTEWLDGLLCRRLTAKVTCQLSDCLSLSLSLMISNDCRSAFRRLDSDDITYPWGKLLLVVICLCKQHHWKRFIPCAQNWCYFDLSFDLGICLLHITLCLLLLNAVIWQTTGALC